MKGWGIAAFAVAVACALPTHADAAPRAAGSAPATAPAAATLAVRAVPIFGAEASVGYGWEDILVTLNNTGALPRKGTLELRTTLSWAGKNAFVSRAPFNVPASHSAVVRLPTRGINDQVPTLSLTVTGDDGKEITSVPVTANMAVAPTLVDIDNPPRLAINLRGWPATVSYSLTPSYAYAYPYGSSTPAMTLAVASPSFDPATGDPVLPVRASAYSGVTAVLVHSDTLARLEPEQRDALLDWVAGGGSLAVVVARPEDLHGPEITRMAGPGVTSAPVNPALFSIPAVPRSGGGAPTPSPFGSGSGGTGGGFGAPAPSGTGTDDDLNDPLDFHPDTAGGAYIPIRTSPSVTGGAGGAAAGGPGPAVRPKLVGFSGGTLVPNGYGSGAHYGRGDVELLAFDPTVSPMLDDTWVQSRMVDFVDHAWDRRAAIVFPTGASPRSTGAMYGYYGSSGRTDEVRRALDPNENFRPALGFAAILLVLYSVLVGPVSFIRSSRRGKPLRPLVLTPILSAATFGLIVGVGLIVKGWRGRARHLALLETAAGSTRGGIVRFRGFYTSETRTLSIPATDRSATVDVMSSDSAMDDAAVLRVDRNGLSLENIRSLPWQTLVVREHGFTDLKGPVVVKTSKSGGLDVTNKTGSTLLDALVYAPGDGVYYFEKIKSGETVSSGSGKLVLSAVSRRGVGAGAMTVHPFDPSGLMSSGVAKKDLDRLQKEWTPFTSSAGEAVDWWPDDKPVVMGELEGGEKVKSDTGLSVEMDRMMVRIVGTGGTP